MAQGRFIVGIMHESRLMCGRCKNYFALSTFPYWDTSDAEQSTQPSKADKVCGGGSLRPGIQKISNHLAQMLGTMPGGKMDFLILLEAGTAKINNTA